MFIVAVFLENMWRIILMLLLLLCSSFFSGSETAFFNISTSQLQSFRKSTHKLQRTVSNLLGRPKRLLTSLLLGNITVNVLFFSLASVLSVRFGSQIGPFAAAAVAFISFFVLLIVGEMLPKSLAYYNSNKFSLAAAPVCALCTRILSPIVRILEILILAPASRLFVGPIRKEKTTDIFSINQLKFLIEQSRQQGLISTDENQLLSEVCEFGLLKVRHVMKPRVDMVTCSISEPPDTIRLLMVQNSLKKIPVYSKNIDDTVGLISLRSLLLNPDSKINKILEKPNFVPEQKTVESLLEFFRYSKTDTAIVVDEYGGITGIVSFEDVIEELLGTAEPSGQDELIEHIGPMEYRLAGALSIHDWSQLFGIDPAQTRLSTIGGLTVALLGRIPKPGDTVYLKNLKLTVETVHRHRIKTLLLSVEPISEQDT
jgi:CBS domain containing-hemolysin-like protein